MSPCAAWLRTCVLCRETSLAEIEVRGNEGLKRTRHVDSDGYGKNSASVRRCRNRGEIGATISQDKKWSVEMVFPPRSGPRVTLNSQVIRSLMGWLQTKNLSITSEQKSHLITITRTSTAATPHDIRCRRA